VNQHLVEDDLAALPGYSDERARVHSAWLAARDAIAAEILSRGEAEARMWTAAGVSAGVVSALFTAFGVGVACATYRRRNYRRV